MLAFRVAISDQRLNFSRQVGFRRRRSIMDNHLHFLLRIDVEQGFREPIWPAGDRIGVGFDCELQRLTPRFLFLAAIPAAHRPGIRRRLAEGRTSCSQP